MAERNITSIMIRKDTKKRFIKQFRKTKETIVVRHFYIDDYINALLDGQEAKGKV